MDGPGAYEIRHDRPLEALIARRQIKLRRNRLIHLAPREHERRAGVHDLDQAPFFAEHHLARSRQYVTRQRPLSLLDADPAHDRQLMPAQLIDIRRIEPHVGVDPHQLLEPLGKRITRQLTPRLIHRRIPPHPPHRIPARLERPQRFLARRVDVVRDGNEDHAAGGVHGYHPSSGVTSFRSGCCLTRMCCSIWT
jgi:hypothetical protein